MKIALSGSGGFVGSHLARELVARGHRVRALAHHSPPAGRSADAGIQTIVADVTEPASLPRWLSGCDAVIHLVGIIAERGDATFERIHVAGTRNVVDAARAASITKIVQMSALGARDEPNASAYHRTKREAEKIVQAGGLRYTIVRPSLIAGPGSEFVSMLSRMLRYAPAVPLVGDGRFRLQPVWVSDVATVFADAVEGTETEGRTLEIGGPEQLTYREVLQTIARVQHTPRPLIPVPVPVFRTIAAVGAALPFPAPITPDQLQMLLEENITADNALPDLLDTPPIRFEEGLRRMFPQS